MFDLLQDSADRVEPSMTIDSVSGMDVRIDQRVVGAGCDGEFVTMSSPARVSILGQSWSNSTISAVPSLISNQDVLYSVNRVVLESMLQTLVDFSASALTG